MEREVRVARRFSLRTADPSDRALETTSARIAAYPADIHVDSRPATDSNQPTHRSRMRNEVAREAFASLDRTPGGRGFEVPLAPSPHPRCSAATGPPKDRRARAATSRTASDRPAQLARAEFSGQNPRESVANCAISQHGRRRRRAGLLPASSQSILRARSLHTREVAGLLSIDPDAPLRLSDPRGRPASRQWRTIWRADAWR